MKPTEPAKAVLVIPPRRKRWKPILLVGVGVLLWFKVDNILWGYIGLTAVSIFTFLGFLGFGVWLLVDLIRRSKQGKWPRSSVIALLGFLAFEPYFPSPSAPFLLGLYLRVRQQVDFQDIRDRAMTYKFRQESPPPGETPGTEPAGDPFEGAAMFPASRLSRSLRGIFGVGEISPEDRTARASGGYTFSSEHGLVVGPAARQMKNHWNPFDPSYACLKLADDVAVWVAWPRE